MRAVRIGMKGLNDGLQNMRRRVRLWLNLALNIASYMIRDEDLKFQHDNAIY
jgi:hypothetical protein